MPSSVCMVFLDALRLRVFPECVAEGFPFSSWGPGVQEATRGRCVVSAKRPQSVRKRPQSVRKRPQSVRGGSDMPESLQSQKSSRNAELSSLFTFRIT